MSEKKKSAKIGGISTNVFVIPLIVVLTILYVTVIILIYSTNEFTNRFAVTSQRFGASQNELTDLQAGAGVLSETSMTFVLNPITEDGSVNVGSLAAYASELGVNRRGPAVAARMHNLTESKEALKYVDTAADYAEKCLEIQLHALSLMRSVYTLPPIPALDAIPEVPLSEEELALSPDARLEAARGLMLGSEYGKAKFYLNQNVTDCTLSLQERFQSVSEQNKQHILNLRRALWVVMITLLALLILTVNMFYLCIVTPLHSYSKSIAADERLEKRSLLKELRLLSSSYNALLRRRNKLESFLRSAAETDELTGLPNRYSLERNLLENGEAGDSLAVLLFDVNFLKRTNDTEGHLAGDKLIQTTASCIRECFARGGEANCYRFGGDEFVAILRGYTEEDIQAALDRFTLALEREKISVSVGYAITPEPEEGCFKVLMAEADRHMYEQKKRAHGIESGT